VRHAAASAAATLQQIKGSVSSEEQRVFVHTHVFTPDCSHLPVHTCLFICQVRHAAASAAATLQQIKGSVSSEEQRIFDGLRAACGAPAVVATAVAADDGYYPMGTEVKEQLAATAVQSVWQAKHSSGPEVAVAVAVAAY